MPREIYEETSRGTFLNPRRYVICDDRIKIQSPLRVYWFNIPFDDIEKVEIRNPPVIWDAYKQGILFSRKYFFRIYKNDLADLFRHISIEKRSGFWRQIRIAPKNPDKFYNVLCEAIRKYKS